MQWMNRSCNALSKHVLKFNSTVSKKSKRAKIDTFFFVHWHIWLYRGLSYFFDNIAGTEIVRHSSTSLPYHTSNSIVINLFKTTSFSNSTFSFSCFLSFQYFLQPKPYLYAILSHVNFSFSYHFLSEHPQLFSLMIFIFSFTEQSPSGIELKQKLARRWYQYYSHVSTTYSCKFKW